MPRPRRIYERKLKFAKVESRDKIHCDYAEVHMYLGAN